MNPSTTPWRRALAVTVVLICLTPQVGHGEDQADETTAPEAAPVVAVEAEDAVSPSARARQNLVDEGKSLELYLERLSADDSSNAEEIRGLIRQRLDGINQAIANFGRERGQLELAREAESKEVVEEEVSSEQRAGEARELLRELAELRDRALVLEVTLHFSPEGREDKSSDVLKAMEEVYARIGVIENRLAESSTELARESLDDHLLRMKRAAAPVEEEPTVAEEPAAMEEPAATEEPTCAEEPAVTEEPGTTEQPTLTEEPAAAEAPTATAEPTGAEEPAATEEPPGAEEPTISEKPTFEELREQIIRLQREIEEIRAILKSLQERRDN